MKTTPTLFEIEDPVVKRPWQRVAPVVAEATEDDVTGVAGIALWGELLDRLGLGGEADRRNLRPIGPGGYTGGECYRAVVELQLAGDYGGVHVDDRPVGEELRRLGCPDPKARPVDRFLEVHHRTFVEPAAEVAGRRGVGQALLLRPTPEASLPGTLASPRTGLAPAGYRELAFGHLCHRATPF